MLSILGSDCLPTAVLAVAPDAARKLLALYPDDPFVNRTYQELLRRVSREDSARPGWVEEYSARARNRPDDAAAQYPRPRRREH
jgi:hypothetical protein